MKENIYKTAIQIKLVQCEQQQRKLWAYRPLSPDTLCSLHEYYRVGLTYTSNALEGNSLTESETKVIIEDGLTIEGKPLRDVDGNGRVSRLLMNLSLMRNDYNIAIIPAICRAEYIAALEQGHKDADAFLNFVADRVIMTQLDILRLFRESEPAPVMEDPEILLLNTIRRQPGLNAPSLAQHTGRSLRSTQRYLSQLKQSGAIRYEGVAKKGGYYANDGGVK